MDYKNKSNIRLIEKINKLEKQYNEIKFSNTQKILLTTDGSITSILDVLYGKIDLKTIDQHFEKANKTSAKYVNVNIGDTLNYREIIMHKNNKPLIYAISYIPLKRVNEKIKEDLIRADIPIGRILKNYKIETRREINNIKIENTTDKIKEIYKTESNIMTREYTIIHNNEILFWIKEMFPITIFK